MKDWRKGDPEEPGQYLVLRKENPWPTTRIYQGNGEWATRGTVLYWQPIVFPTKDWLENPQ